MRKIFILFLIVFSYTSNSSWISIQGPSNPTKSMLVFNDRLYAGTYGSGVNYYDLSGGSWSEHNNNLTNQNIWRVAVSNNDLYATTDAGVFKSAGGSSNWEKISKDIGGLAFYTIAADDKKVYVSNDNNNIYFTTNAGKNWTELNVTDISYNIRTMAVDKSILYVGCENGKIYKTTDDGNIWNEINNPPLLFSINDVKFVNGKIYAGTLEGGMFRSDDGLKWNDINSGLTSSNITNILYNNSILFVSTKGQGVFYTTDGGNIWIQANDGLGQTDCLTLACDGKYLYTSTSSNEVFKRDLSEFGKIELTAPLLDLPANNATDQDVKSYFSWSAVKGSVFYHLQISKKADCTGDFFVDVDNLIKSSYTANALDYQTTYYWRVASVSSNNEKKWSEIRKLTTGKFVSVDILPVRNMFSTLPNPVIDYLVINSDYELIENAKIYDLKGNLVKFYSFGKTNSIKLDVKELKNGAYFLVTDIENVSYKQKFIKSE